MTGGAFIPSGRDEEYDLDQYGNERHSVQWVGTPGVKGPKWAKMPLLTVGMLGIQCVWSIEMGYASPYLLELGLSKSWMSLVFVAGPLSGLIVQPLIGVFADRSRSPLGRRRPFMLAGCAISVFAMMLLGWTREVSSLMGGGSGLAIGLAVWSIYLIDFSINAVMSTDRALVVDTLPPSLQEEGSAWAGRMFGFGSVAGFFVGNLDLPPVLPFLGKTQLQILSFITSSILIVTHTFTSWGVTERILLRDDRPHSQNSLSSNLRAIWENMFSLPQGIKTVCIIQFCASLGWFPILFFTTVWVSEIYKTSLPEGHNLDSAAISSEAVRTGARALLLNSLVNIVTSICLPFLVSESGVQPNEATNNNTYMPINGTGLESDELSNGIEENGIGRHGSGNGSARQGDQGPTSATWKRAREDHQSGNAAKRLIEWAKGSVKSIADGSALTLPIKGLTLVRVWWVSQFVFAGSMAATWFVRSVYGAYLVIAVTGFCWAIAQWAPYSLLGELILLDTSTTSSQTQLRPIRPSTERISLDRRSSSPVPEPYPATMSLLTTSHEPSPSLHSRHTSRSSMKDVEGAIVRRNSDEDLPRRSLSSKRLSLEVRPGSNPSANSSTNGNRSRNPSPLIIQSSTATPNEFETPSTVVLHHHGDPSSESEDDDNHLKSFESHRSEQYPPRRVSTPSPTSPTTFTTHPSTNPNSTADKAGVILGIHNVFLVLPQFIVTFLSSIIFYLLEPGTGLPTEVGTSGGVVSNPITSNSTDISGVDAVVRSGMWMAERALAISREQSQSQSQSQSGGHDAVGLIFRIGGVSAAVGGVICWRMSREWAKGRGV